MGTRYLRKLVVVGAYALPLSRERPIRLGPGREASSPLCEMVPFTGMPPTPSVSGMTTGNRMQCERQRMVFDRRSKAVRDEIGLD
jgi:hypothetical protein